MKFRKRPVIISATQWFKMGDHEKVVPVPPHMKGYMEIDLQVSTEDRGYLGTLEFGHIVDPGDWIIVGVDGELYPCKPDIFDRTYEPVPEEHDGQATQEGNLS